MEVFRASAGRRLTVAIALAATLGLSASGCIAAAPAPTPTPDVASRLGAYLQKTVDAGAVGLLVRIDTGDTVIELVRQIAWAEDDRPGFSPDSLAEGGVYMIGQNKGPKLLTALDGG